MAVEEEEDGVDLAEADLAEEAEEDSEEDVEALVVVVPGDLEEVVVEAVASEEAGDESWEPWLVSFSACSSLGEILQEKRPSFCFSNGTITPHEREERLLLQNMYSVQDTVDINQSCLSLKRP